MADGGARARGYSLILLALCAIAIAGWIALSDGLIDRNGKPIGTDFSSVYAAGTLVLEGPRRRRLRHGRALRRASSRSSAAATPYYGWLYPPIFLFVATPLALLPYPLALAVWQGATFALYLAVIAAILRRLAARRRHDRAALAAGRGRIPRRLHQSRPRPERLSHRGTAGRRAAWR